MLGAVGSASSTASRASWAGTPTTASGPTGTPPARTCRGRRPSGPRSSSSPTCASPCSRTTCVRTYAEGQTTGYADPQAEVPAFARRWRTADGSWNDLSTDEAGRVDPMVGAAYTRFFRNVGDDKGLAGVASAGDTGDRSGERARGQPQAARGEGPAGRGAVPQPAGARAWIQFQNHDWISHGDNLDGRDRSRSRSPRTTRPRALSASTRCSSAAPNPTRPDDGAGRGDAGDLHQRGHPLVGRLADLRQRPGDAGPPARAASTASCALTDDGTLPARSRDGHRGHRVRAQLVGRAGDAAHPLRARAQRHLRQARERLPRLGRRRLFNIARLVNAAVMAKIHSIEWTPAILPNHGADVGLQRELVRHAHLHVPQARRASTVPRTSTSPTPSSAGSSATAPTSTAAVRAGRGVRRGLPAALAAARGAAAAPPRRRRRASRTCRFAPAGRPARRSSPARVRHEPTSSTRSANQHPGALVSTTTRASCRS